MYALGFIGENTRFLPQSPSVPAPSAGSLLALAFPLGKVGFEVYPRRSDEVVVIYYFYLIRHTQANFRMPPSPRGRLNVSVEKENPEDEPRGYMLFELVIT